MFQTILRINRQSSNNVFYFLQIIFFLHVCTAFITIVNALNNNDNEGLIKKKEKSIIQTKNMYYFRLAIIQLSVDSIHVVKSSDSRFTVNSYTLNLMKINCLFFLNICNRILKKMPMMMKRKNCLLHY